jgi:hypothetical protein
MSPTGALTITARDSDTHSPGIVFGLGEHQPETGFPAGRANSP